MVLEVSYSRIMKSKLIFFCSVVTILFGNCSCQSYPCGVFYPPGGDRTVQSYGAYSNASLIGISLEVCQQTWCAKTAACVGVDYNTYNGQNSCWLTFSGTSIGASQSSNSIVHYYYDSCSQPKSSESPTGCYWKGSTNTNSPSGSFQNGVSTLNQCFSRCSVTTQCLSYGLDWIPDTSQCYFSNYPVLSYGTSQGTNHYDWTCPTLSTTPATGCKWNISQNSFSPRGTYQSSFTTLATCQDNCNYAGSLCPGFDWNMNNGQCFFSEYNNFIGYGQANGVVHYQKICAAGTRHVATVGIVAALLILVNIL